MEYGIQMYSVRDLTEKDLDGALKQIAEIGYANVEFAGFFGHTADEVAAMLDRYGLKASGTHTGIGDLLADPDGQIAFHQAIGAKHIIIPGADIWTKEKLDAFIDGVNAIQPKIEAAGLTLGFHNHHREFAVMEEGYVPYDEIAARTSMKLEIDTYWAYVAGKDPVALMEQYKDRLHFIHIKDGDAKGEGTPLGMGTAPVPAVYAKAVELGVPMVVESETLNPDGMTEARICFADLKSLEA